MNSIIKEIWNRRSLIVMFSTTELKARYRNSALGFFWSFLEPLLLLAVLYIAFTTLFKTAIPNYPLYLLLGLIFWGMYNRGTSMGLTSILGKAGLVTKTYFPREIPVLSSNITAFIMMIFEFGAFAIFLVAFQFVPSITILLLPIILVSLFIYTLGISFGLSVLGIRFKDLHSIWTVLLQATFFMTPIIFTLDIYPEQVRHIISLNPLVTILTMAHEVTLYGKIPPLVDFVRIYVTSFAFLFVGYLIFKRLNNKIIEEL